MSQRQEQISDNLSITMQRIHREARTGYLRVERGEGPNLESGLVRFVDGKIVAARVGQEQGNIALNILLTWERCFFVFYPTDRQGNIQEHSADQEPPGRRNTQPFNQDVFATNPHVPVARRNSESFMSLPLTAVPRATMSIMKAIALAEKAGLPQLCRPIILAIDGRATVGELIARIGCTPEEMFLALIGMERLAIVRIIR